MKLKLISFFVLLMCLQGFAVEQNEKLSRQAYIHAMTFFNNARYTQAIDEFSKAIALDSTNYNAWIRRGYAKGITGDFEGEYADYSTVISHDPQHKFAYISRGSALNKVNKFAEALIDFNKAIAIDPGDAEAYNNRGFAYKGLGNTEAACSDWNKSKQLGNSEAKIILQNNHCQ